MGNNEDIIKLKGMVILDTGNCRLCKRDIGENKNNGISILGVYICKDCLDEISETNIGSIKYGYYKLAIKKLWIDYITASN